MKLKPKYIQISLMLGLDVKMPAICLALEDTNNEKHQSQPALTGELH